MSRSQFHTRLVERLPDSIPGFYKVVGNRNYRDAALICLDRFLQSLSFNHAISAGYALSSQDDGETGAVKMELVTQFAESRAGPIAGNEFINLSWKQSSVDLLVGSRKALLGLLQVHLEQLTY